MPIARKYTSPEVRKMLQGAEHKPSPITGAGAHSRTLHAGATPGGVGATKSAMIQRTHKQPGESNNQFKQRGGAPKTSAFANLLQQSEAVCQALNSTTGQQALRVLDSAAHAGKDLRVTVSFGPIKEAGFLPGSGTAKMSVASKNAAGVQKPAGGAAGIRVILDRAANQSSLHIQTCMPLDTLAGSSYQVKDMAPGGAVIAQG